MSDTPNSRRDFLTQSAKLATAAGLATAVAAQAMSPARPIERGDKIKVTAGPKPRQIGPNETIRLGLIGIGGQGRHDLERLLKNNKNISVKAIADPDPTNAKKAADLVKSITG